MPEITIRRRTPGAAEEALRARVHPLLARIYAARGVAHVDELDLSLGTLLKPDALGGIDAAAELLADAAVRDRRVLVVGDFDADGATASALAVAALRELGVRHADFLVPNRFEFGYGLTPEIVALALRSAPDVIVTVDNGISSVDGVAAARAAGVDVVVTDHHLPGRLLPAANAIVNPNLPDCGFGSKALAGVGVVFYVLCRMRQVLIARGVVPAAAAPNLGRYLDLVALGTVADVVPLDHNNRVLVNGGLERMRAGRARPGIAALCEVAGRPLARLTATDLAFAIGPRLNAAGRLDDMSIGIRCLLASDAAEAHELAVALNELNQARRQIEHAMTADASAMLAAVDGLGDALSICVYDPSWHQGVVGIVAGRLKERYHRPVIAFADAGDSAPDELKGSARSVDGLHVRDALDAIAGRTPGLIQKFGGHAMAAGVSVRRRHLAHFRRAFETEAGRWLSAGDLGGIVLSDGELGAQELTLDAARLLGRAGPWGQRFPEPLFHGEFAIVHERPVGRGHLKLVLERDGRVVDAIAFGREPLGASRALLAYRLGENDYGDVPTLQLVVEHLEPC